MFVIVAALTVSYVMCRHVTYLSLYQVSGVSHPSSSRISHVVIDWRKWIWNGLQWHNIRDSRSAGRKVERRNTDSMVISWAYFVSWRHESKRKEMKYNTNLIWNSVWRRKVVLSCFLWERNKKESSVWFPRNHYRHTKRCVTCWPVAFPIAQPSH